MSIPKNEQTRIAVLGTLAEFHHEPIPYNMVALLALVESINPDLLCLDMTQDQWQTQVFEDLPPEYKEALLPLAHQTDIVVAPIAGGQPPPKPEATGWRCTGIHWLRRWIATIQRTAPGPDAINQGWRHHLANYLYSAIRWLSAGDGESTAHEHADQLTQAVLQVAHRDPGARILVVVNVQYCHIIRERLRHYEDIEITTYAAL